MVIPSEAAFDVSRSGQNPATTARQFSHFLGRNHFPIDRHGNICLNFGAVLNILANPRIYLQSSLVEQTTPFVHLINDTVASVSQILGL